ncbi:hypothetical protein ACTFQF_00725 [Aliivibrio fischeri]|nr:hypothetical protein [Aliivibrio fischeri]MUK37578.1 hypothetical protein [Aliivibrio fischeri]
MSKIHYAINKKSELYVECSSYENALEISIYLNRQSPGSNWKTSYNSDGFINFLSSDENDFMLKEEIKMISGVKTKNLSIIKELKALVDLAKEGEYKQITVNVDTIDMLLNQIEG